MIERATAVDDRPATEADRLEVTRLLGRPPASTFSVVVRRTDGGAAVIRNAPFLDDGTPMPTRYWLVDPILRSAIGTLESGGGVRRAEAEVDPDEVQAAHDRYARERDAAVPTDHVGPRPTGGVGGTRRGVKCLHAHYAWHLAGGDDPVGRWVHLQLDPTITIAGTSAAPPTGPASSTASAASAASTASTASAPPVADG